MSSINKYEMCFCGSGKTYKFCHNRYDQKKDSMMTNSLSLRTFSEKSKLLISEFTTKGGFHRGGSVNYFGVSSDYPKYSSMYFSEEVILRKLGVGVVFSVSPDGNGIELFKIEVDNEGSGIGTQIMELLISLSEKYGVEVVLTPNPWKSKKDYDYYDKLVRLSDWYRRLGFQFVENSVYMKYRPKSVEYKLVS